MRKYVAGEIKALNVLFPEPIYTGNPSLWWLAEVLPWLDQNTELHPQSEVRDLAVVTSQMNLDVQRERLRRAMVEEIVAAE